MNFKAFIAAITHEPIINDDAYGMIWCNQIKKCF